MTQTHTKENEMTMSMSVVRFNKTLKATIAKLAAECRRQKVTLYLSHTLDDGRLVYQIKELPTFKAIFSQPRML
jgi:hypothetical protein